MFGFSPLSSTPLSSLLQTARTYTVSISETGNASDPIITAIGNFGVIGYEYSHKNYIKFPNTYGVSPWYSGNAVVSNAAVLAPDGTYTGQLLQETAVNSSHSLNYSLTLPKANTTYTFSCYVKPYTADRIINFQFHENPANSYAVILLGANLSSIDTAAQVTPRSSYSNASGTVTAAANGWYRVNITATTGVQGSTTLSLLLNNAGAQNYAGNGNSGIYLWGMQFEEGVSPTALQNPYSVDTGASQLLYTPSLTEILSRNILYSSGNFDVSYLWLRGPNPSTPIANATISPDGTNTAALWTRTVTGANYLASLGISKAPIPTPYTWSIYVKQSVGNYCALRFQGNYPSRADVVFDISNGTISTAATAYSSFSNATASITSVGSGWYRISLSATTDSFTGIQTAVSFNSNGTVIDGTDSVSNSAGYIWGAQFEVGNSATTLLETPLKEVLSTSRVNLNRTRELATTNLVDHSQDTADWEFRFSTLQSTTELAPDGTYTAIRYTPTSQYGGIVPGSLTGTPNWLHDIPMVGSVWLRVASGTKQVGLGLNAGGTGVGVTVTSTWQRFSNTYKKSATYDDLFQIYEPNSSGFVDIYVWGVQVEIGTTPSAYQVKPIIESNTPQISVTPKQYEFSNKNLLSYPENFTAGFSSGAMFQQNGIGSLTLDATPSPFGTPSYKYNLVALSGRGLGYYYNFIANRQYTFSVYLKAIVDTTWGMYLSTTGGISEQGTTSAITVAGGWTRVSYTFVTTINSRQIQFQDLSGSTGDRFYCFGAQLEEGSIVTPYVTVADYGNTQTTTLTAAPQITESGGANDDKSVSAVNTATKIELARKNLVVKSNVFDNTTNWFQQAATPIPYSTTSPFGTSDAYFLRESATLSNGHFVQQVPTFEKGYQYTYSVYAKASTRSYLLLLIGSGAIPGQQNAFFNLTTGAITGINTVNGTTAAISDAGNGWWRCSITTPAAISTGLSTIWISVSDSTPTVVYTGDGTSGIYIYGAQMEQGTVPTQYVDYEDTSIITGGYSLEIPITENGTAIDSEDQVVAAARSSKEWATTNFVDYSQDGTQWSLNPGTTIISTTELAPDGTYTAVRVRPTLNYSGVRSSTGVWLHDIQMVGSAWVKVDTGTQALQLGLTGGGLGTNVTATTTWTRVSGTLLKSANYNDTFLVMSVDASRGDFIVWGIQVEVGSTPSTYQVKPIVENQSTTAIFNSNKTVERISKNRYLNSEDINLWSQTNTTTNANSVANPLDGTLTADQVTNTINLNSAVTMSQIPNGGWLAGTTMTKSVYAKLITGSQYLYFQAIPFIGNYINVQFDLSNGTVAGTSGSSTATITPVGNGWYRCVQTFTVPSYSVGNSNPIAGDSFFIGGYGSTNLNTTHALYGAQLEIGSSATSYQYTGSNTSIGGSSVDALTNTLQFSRAKTEVANKNLLNTANLSETFTYSYWVPNGGLVVQNATTAPDGTSLAVKLVEVAILGNQRMYSQVATEIGIYTYSVYLKPAERYIVRVYVSNEGGDVPPSLSQRSGNYINFNLAPGSQIYQTYVTSAAGGVINSSLQDVGNGWYRYSLTVKSTWPSSTGFSGSSYFVISMADATGNYNYTGDGTSGMYVWGAQMEIGNTVTPYVSVANYGNTQTSTLPASTNLTETGTAVESETSQADFYPALPIETGSAIESETSQADFYPALPIETGSATEIGNNSIASNTNLTEISNLNYIKYPEYNSASWFNVFPAGAYLTTGIDDPNGGRNAVRLTGTNAASALLRVNFPAFTADGITPYTCSFYVRKISGTTVGNTAGVNLNYITADLNDSADNNYFSSLITNTWVRYSFTLIPAAGSKNFLDLLSNRFTDYVLDFWGAQVQVGTVATPVIINDVLSSSASENTNLTETGTAIESEDNTTSASSQLTETGTAVENYQNSLAALSYSYETSNNNLLNLVAEDFSKWNKNAAPYDWTVNTDVAVAPNGTNTADLIIKPALYGSSIVYKGFPVNLAGQTNTSYVGSVYLKAAGYSKARVNFENNAFNNLSYGASVDLIAGTVYQVLNGSTVTITNAGNGWWRITVTAISDADGGNYIFAFSPVDSSYNQSFIGDGTSGIYAWGAQVEYGTVASPYVSSSLADSSTNTTALTAISPEYSRNNIFNSSDTLNVLPWATNNASIVPGIIDSNTGALSYKLIDANANTGNKELYQNQYWIKGATYTVSVYVKAAERDTFRIGLQNGTIMAGSGNAYFYVSNNGTGNNFFLNGYSSNTITYIADGWYRCTATFTVNGTGGFGGIYFTMANNGGASTNANYTGDGVSGMYFLRPQVELGSVATPWTLSTIDTESTTVANLSAISESSSKNLIRYSNDFSNTTWIVGGVVKTSINNSAPDGSSNALLFTTAGTGLQSIYEPIIPVVPNTTYTFSFYAKLGTLASSEWLFAVYNETALTMIASDIAPSITLDGTWQRVTYTFTTPANCSLLRVYPFRNFGLATVKTGYVWGPQLELGSSATSYVYGLSDTNSNTATLLGSSPEKLVNNRLTYSEDFNNGLYWLKQAGMTFLPNYTDPTGNNNASKLVETTNNYYQRMYVAHQLTNTMATLSCYVKSDGSSRNVYLKLWDSVTDMGVVFNPSTGAFVSYSPVSITGSYSSTSVGNGWYRLSISTYLAKSGDIAIGLTNGTTYAPYAGDTTVGVYVWGVQLETGDTVTNYVKMPVSEIAGLRLVSYQNLSEHSNLNILENYYNFSYWNKSAQGTAIIPVVTVGYDFAPDGINLADKIDFDSGGNGNSNIDAPGTSGSPAPGQTRTFSVYLRTLTGTTSVTMFNGSAITNVSVTTTWQRFVFTYTGAGTGYGVRLAKRELWGTSGAASVLAWGAQWEEGSVATTYIPSSLVDAVTGDKLNNTLNAIETVIAQESSLNNISTPTSRKELLNKNTLLYPEDFSNFNWGKGGTSVTPGIVAPDGTYTAYKLVESAVIIPGNNYHYIVQYPVTYAAGTTYTISVYAKAAERTLLQIQSDATSSNIVGIFDLSNGTLGGAPGGGALNITGAITDAGNGWYRCSVTGLSKVNVNAGIKILLGNAGYGNQYNGDGTSGFYIWGAQIEQGALTPYVSVANYANIQSSQADFYPQLPIENGTATESESVSAVNIITLPIETGTATDNNTTSLTTSISIKQSLNKNLFTAPEDFTTGWVLDIYTNAVTIPSVITNPFGGSTATKIAGNTSNLTHSIQWNGYYTNLGLFSGVSNTISIYVKAAEYTKFYICDAGAGTFGAYFDLTAVTATVVSSCTANITAAGNGWYRCSVTLPPTIVFGIYTRPGFGGYPTGAASAFTYGFSYVGDNTSGVYVWGAQLELNSSATPYVSIADYSNIQSSIVSFANSRKETLSNNYYVYSQDFTKALPVGWYQSANWTFEPNQIIAPDGTLTGTKFTGTVASAPYLAGQASILAGYSYTYSIYVKAGTQALAGITLYGAQFNNGVGTGFLNWDLSTGTLVNGQTIPSFYTAYGIQSAGNGWYRIYVTVTSTTDSVIDNQQLLRMADGNYTIGKYLYIWGAQCEVAASPLSGPTPYVSYDNYGNLRTAQADFYPSLPIENLNATESESVSAVNTITLPIENLNATESESVSAVNTITLPIETITAFATENRAFAAAGLLTETGNAIQTETNIITSPTVRTEKLNKNLLPYPENFIDGISSGLMYQQSSVTLTSDVTASPFGLPSYKYSLSGAYSRGLGYYYDLIPNKQYTFSIYLKAIVDTSYTFALATRSSGYLNPYGPIESIGSNTPLTVAAGWTRASFTFVPISAAQIQVQDYSGLTGDRFYCFGAQLEEGTLTPYVPSSDYGNTQVSQANFYPSLPIENVSSDEASSKTLLFGKSIQESGNAVEQYTTLLSYLASRLEPNTAVDSVGGGVPRSVSRLETALAVDSVSTIGYFVVNRQETLNALHVNSSSLSASSAAREIANALDLETAESLVYRGILEQVDLRDYLVATNFSDSYIIEVITAIDGTLAFVFLPIDYELVSSRPSSMTEIAVDQIYIDDIDVFYMDNAHMFADVSLDIDQIYIDNIDVLYGNIALVDTVLSDEIYL